MSNKNTFSDMPVDEFKKLGHQLVNWVADYIDGIETRPVLPDVVYGDIKKKLEDQPPFKSDKLKNIISDIDEKIIPGITHWNHPDFMAYFNSTSSGPGILADLLSSGFNANVMAWHTCPSATELEELMIGWYREIFNLPENFWGIVYDTASVSSFHAIAAAREYLSDLEIRKKGMAGRNDLPPLRIYASEHAHLSISKAAIALGFGIEAIRKIPSDDKFRMIPAVLKEAIEEDKKNGLLPCCIVATVGTTSTTSVDPVDDISTICNRENIWLHIDAAYAGNAAILPEKRWMFKGIEKANSLVVNPHKWMFTPFDFSLLFTKNPGILKRAFSLSAEYFDTSKDVAVNYMDYSIQQGRRFRALKPWFIMRYFGVEGLQNRIREHIHLAKMFSEWIESSDDFEVSAPVDFGVVCFRAIPQNITDVDEINSFNERLINKINKTGKLFLSHTNLNGKFILRICISGLRTQEEHVKKAWKLINELSKE